MTQSESFIIFSDIKRLAFKTRWVILAGAVFFGLFGFFKRSQVPVRHEIKAVFKEVGPSQTPFGGGMFDSFLQTLGMGGVTKEGHVLLLSSIILEPVIMKLGMQADIPIETSVEKKRRLFLESLDAERGRPIVEPSRFVFENVRYLGEYPKGFLIFFTSRESFEVRDEKSHVLAKGVIGESVSFNGITFTLKETPTRMKLRNSYPLLFSSLPEMVIQVRKLFEVLLVHGDASLLSLEMTHADRHFGMRLLNEIMETYKNYLETENSRVTEGQIAYLQNRRNSYTESMNELLKEHVAYLKENIESKGALNLGQQLPLFQGRKQDLMNELMEIELKFGELIDANPYLAMEIGSEVVALQGELHEIAKERDALALALIGQSSYEKNLTAQMRRLDVIEREELRVKTGVDSFFSAMSHALRQKDQTLVEVGEFGKILSPAACQLKKVQLEKKKLVQLSSERSGTQLSNSYLKNQLRLLSLQEGILKQRLFHGTSREEEYRGIDLETARKLLFTYLNGRDNASSKIRELIFAKEQIEKEDAEWASLSSIFPDPLSQEMVREMGVIKQKLRKERTLTEKEQERLEKQFSRMKDDLGRHIKQSVLLAQLECERNEDRIESVRIAILDLLGQEVSLIEKQIEDRIEEKLAHLEKEKLLVKGQLKDIKKEMEGVPDTWLREHRLKFASDMNKGMLEALVHLVESKSIEQNLSILESGPIDYAQASLNPKPPLLKVFGVIGGFLGALITFACCFIYYLYRGFPLTLRNMRVRGKKVLGPLTKKDDIEVLRRFSLLLKKENKSPIVACLVLGNGDDYAPSFAELLAKEGKRVLVMDLNFTKKVKERNLPGLIHYLEGDAKAPSIRVKHYGDYLPMGGNTSFGEEMLRNRKFEMFLNEMKKEYEVILLSLPSRLESSLPKSFFGSADVIALRLEDHPFSALEPYFAWESEGHSLAFV